MDLCVVLSHFSPVTPSNLSYSNDSIAVGNLPDPNLFFTWYCEKAREVEKYSGSIEFGIKLLDLALNNLSPSSRIAKRFILATRNSLTKYNLYINNLAKKIENDTISHQERSDILQALRSADLKSFETMGVPKSCINDEPSELVDDSLDPIKSPDFSTDMSLLDLIIQEKFRDAFSQARHIVFFPSAILENNQLDHFVWLKSYCNALIKECTVYFDSLNSPHITGYVTPEMCGDRLSQAIFEFSQDENQTEEQAMSLLLAKSKMAVSVLDSRKKAKIEDDIFF
jgi:hypothetical protein